ncbi:glycyl-tRNA synthetase [Tanacetum coccineum]
MHDDNSTIQHKYTRTDENGVAFNVTVVSTSSVLILERDTQEQNFVSVEEVATVVKELCEGHSTYAELNLGYPICWKLRIEAKTSFYLWGVTRKNQKKTFM